MRSLAAGVLILNLGACTEAAFPAPATVPETPITPQEFVAPDKSFRITFPAPRVESIATDVGTSSEQVGARARVHRGDVFDTYEVTTTDVADADVGPSIDALLDGLEKQGSIRFDERRPARSGALVGREIDVHAADHLERWRYFRQGSRVFVLGVVTTDRALPPAAPGFLDSFAVIGGVPQRIRGLPDGMDVRLPSAGWRLGARNRNEEGCVLTAYVRTGAHATASAPLFSVCAAALANDETLAGFAAYAMRRSPYVRDAPIAPGPDWPLSFPGAVGFYAHTDGPAPSRALVFYALQNHVGFTLVLEASDTEFAQLESEFRALLQSVRPPAERRPAQRSDTAAQ